MPALMELRATTPRLDSEKHSAMTFGAELSLLSVFCANTHAYHPGAKILPSKHGNRAPAKARKAVNANSAFVAQLVDALFNELITP